MSLTIPGPQLSVKILCAKQNITIYSVVNRAGKTVSMYKVNFSIGSHAGMKLAPELLK